MIQRSEIRAYVKRLAQEFNPERVILFGSHARGKPTEDSDVDLLVVADYRGDGTDKAVEIRLRIPRKFASSGNLGAYVVRAFFDFCLHMSVLLSSFPQMRSILSLR